MLLEAIHEEVATRGQTVYYTEVLRLRGSPVKIEIASQPRADQCFARATRWDGAQWQPLHDLQDIRTPALLCLTPPALPSYFKADRDVLLDVCDKILR